MANADSRASWEFACKLFYAAHWFNLTEADLANLLQHPDRTASETVTELLALVAVLEAANPDDCNAPIESWCATVHESLSSTPAEAVKNGRFLEVKTLVESLGKLPA